MGPDGELSEKQEIMQLLMRNNGDLITPLGASAPQPPSFLLLVCSAARLVSRGRNMCKTGVAEVSDHRMPGGCCTRLVTQLHIRRIENIIEQSMSSEGWLILLLLWNWLCILIQAWGSAYESRGFHIAFLRISKRCYGTVGASRSKRSSSPEGLHLKGIAFWIGHHST